MQYGETIHDPAAAEQERRYWSRFDPAILERNPQTREKFREFFESIIGPRRPARVLDLGCGTGLYHPILAPMVGQLVGMDRSLAMLRRAEQLSKDYNLGTELVHGDAQRLPFPDGAFDLVIAYDVLHHVPDIGAAAEEIRRVLMPGGRFVAAETTMLSPWVLAYNLFHRDEWGLLRIRPGLLRRAFRGFAQFRLRPDNTRFFSHSPLLERIFGLMDRYVLRGPLKMISTRYVIEAHVAPLDAMN
ncbi:MAG: class I SAM-dependent methyltransferase [Phycisphaerae bacterium]|nr:class I SAM-dependent methyltransferase [Phycisphaerae bacterium]